MKFVEDICSSKNGNLRARLSQYLMLIISEYPIEVLDRNLAQVETYINHALSDANPEARLFARRAYLIWEQKHSHSARKISAMFDVSV